MSTMLPHWVMQFCVSQKVMLFERKYEEVGVCVETMFPGKAEDLRERLHLKRISRDYLEPV